VPIGAGGKQNLVPPLTASPGHVACGCGEGGTQLALSTADKRQPYGPRTPYIVGQTGQFLGPFTLASGLRQP
jgi:hypothetical protein